MTAKESVKAAIAAIGAADGNRAVAIAILATAILISDTVKLCNGVERK